LLRSPRRKRENGESRLKGISPSKEYVTNNAASELGLLFLSVCVVWCLGENTDDITSSRKGEGHEISFTVTKIDTGGDEESLTSTIS